MSVLKHVLTIIVLLSAGAATWAQTAPATRPATTRAAAGPAERVLVISVDGLRPDVALRAKMPHLRALYEGGSFSFWARTTDVAVTLPSHVSMLTGVPPAEHGVTWNDDREITADMRIKRATLFEAAKDAGLSTAVVSGKAKFVILANKPGVVDHVSVPKGTIRDAWAAENAAKIIRENKPQVMFVHLAGCDGVGHAKGWGSPEQVVAAEQADAAIGTVLAALDEAGVRKQTLVIVTADHGGAGRSHGANDPRSLHIPWIANGPGVRPNHDLTLYRELTVRTEDTFATALAMLGLPVPEGITGKFVAQIQVPEPASTQPATTTAPAATAPAGY